MASSKKKIRVPGRDVSSGDTHLEAAESLLRIEVSITRDADAIEFPETKDDDVVSFVYEDGFHRFVRVSDLESEGFVARSRSSDGALMLETTLVDSQTRGVGSGLKLVELLRAKATKKLSETFKEKVKKKAGEQAALALCRGIERNYVPQQGLFEIDVEGISEAWIPEDATPFDQPPNCPDGPVLLMLHGTASSTDGAFVGLGQSARFERWKRVVKDTYGGRLWAFNHHTLTESPLTNAIALLDSLPSGVELHIVSHSRGGLLGELICLDAFDLDERDKDLFDNAQAEDFQRFKDLLKEKRPTVKRFVRIACPALGTTLASERLDRYLTGLFNVLEFFANGGKYIALGHGAVPLYYAGDALEKLLTLIKECIVVLVSQKADVNVLPGLAAMLPDSAVVRLLNRAGRKTEADLTVIAGDVKSVGGEKRRFANLAGDLFYLEEHDWVVNTRAMYGGISRRSPRYYLSRGAGSNHLRYFVNSDTFDALCEALTGNLKRFHPIEEPSLKEPNWWEKLKFLASRDGQEDTRPVVFLLPGIMGSHLYVDGVPVWLSPEAISDGAFVNKLSYGKHTVTSPGVLYRFYGALAEFLSLTHRVEVYPYDWRHSVEKLGMEFATKVSQVAEETGARRIRFLGHSMGGLVVRSMMTRPEWFRVKSRVDRIVMLGVPNKGSYKTLQILLGEGGVFNPVNLLAAGDFEHNKKTILATIQQFPGLLSLLPPEVCLAQQWSGLLNDSPLLSGVSNSVVQQISQFWGKLVNSVDTERMVYVAGQASGTPLEYSNNRFKETHEGDGTVPWDRGQLPGVPTYYTDADHGNLPRHYDAFEAYLELLAEGVSTKPEVRSEKPKRRWWNIFRDGSNAQKQTEAVLPDDRPLRFPQLDDYEDAALGARWDYHPTIGLGGSKILVQVAHGDLAYAKFPVVLGHYAEQPLEGSEWALDKRLGGRLSRDRRFGVYPGPLGTSRQYLVEDDLVRRFRGGIVVGLGEFGALTPGALTRTVNQAVLDFLLTRTNHGAHSENCLSFVSIGSMEGGVSLSESLACIMSAVQQANLTIKGEEGLTKPIARIQFVELFQSRAIETARTVRQLCGSSHFVRDFISDSSLTTIGGGIRRVGGVDGRTDWQRLDVSRLKDTGATTELKFKLLTKDAHNEEMSLELENCFIDTFLHQTSRDCKWDPELSHTLFEMLVPLRLKEFGDDGRHLLLLLTEATARYPWEMLMDGLGDQRLPMSVRGSMVRQLSSMVGKPRKLATLQKTVLLVGDPPSNLPELRGAQEEVGKVAELLTSHHFDVECLMRPKGHTVVTKLFAKPYRILHLSGHGTYAQTQDGKPRAGMVLGEGLLLTSSVLSQIRICPELVFINCCHLGRLDEIETALPSLAANLATEMIRAGAKAVIAAGWAVEDRAAERFSCAFYEQMLAGRTFGKAVWEARKATFKDFQQFNTWGAYQAYGDPDYTLRLRSAHDDGWTAEEFLSPVEAIVALENLKSIAEVSHLADFESLFERMEELLSCIPEHWYTGSSKNYEVILGLARAYGRLVHPLYGFTTIEADRHLTEAVKFYRLADESPFITVDDINFKLRFELLAAIYSESPDFERVLEVIEAREKLAEQSGNWKAQSRVGGAAMTALSFAWSDQKSVNKLLDIMEKWYQDALGASPADNYLRDYVFLGRLCRGWSIGGDELPYLELGGDSFFAVLAGARRRLLRWLADGAVDAGYQEVEDRLVASWECGASPMEFKSVLELLEFLIVMRRRLGHEPDSLLESLESLKARALLAVGWDGSQ